MGDLLWTLEKFPHDAQSRICTPESLPSLGAPALVLGASVQPDREPSPVLEERLRTALALHAAGKVRWFLVSGDNRAASYNEPKAMTRWLARNGVSPTLVVSDYAGRRTLDSLKRAQAIFGVDQVVIVTSDFHMARALFIARNLGMDAWGMPASTAGIPWPKRLGFWIREYVARNKALWDYWFPPNTMLGPREPTPEDWLPPKSAAPVREH